MASASLIQLERSIDWWYLFNIMSPAPPLSPFAWPLACLPRICGAGRYLHAAMHFEYPYRNVTHALHLYEYPGTIELLGRRIAFAPGDLTLTPASQLTRYALPKAGRHWCIHFYPAGPSAGQITQLPLHLPLGAEQDFLARKMAAVAMAFNGPGDPALGAARASAALQELLLWLASRFSQSARTDAGGRIDRAIDEAIEYLSQHLDKPLDVSRFVKHIGFSQNYFARHFRRRTGHTLQQYLLQRRIEAACQLLIVTTQPIQQIGVGVGLPDPQYFNKQFRRLTGLSPGAWRRRNQHDAERPTTNQ